MVAVWWQLASPLRTPAYFGERRCPRIGEIAALILGMEKEMTLRLIAGGDLTTEIADRSSKLQFRCSELADDIAALTALMAQQTSASATQSSVLTVDEVAAELRVSRTTIFGLLRDGRLQSFHEGRRRLVARADLEAHIRASIEAS